MSNTKDLMTAIQSRLRSDINYIRSESVYITPDVTYIPESVRPPAIAIKDGSISNRIRAGHGRSLDQDIEIQVVLWSDLLQTETAIMGSDVTAEKGIFELAQDVWTSLDKFKALPEVIDSFCESENGVTQHVGGFVIHSKVMIFKFLTTTSRPGGNR